MVLMDCFAQADPVVMAEAGIQRGCTTFVDAACMDELLARVERDGLLGSHPGDNARNLCEAASFLGARTTFLSAIGDDAVARRWRAAMRSLPVHLHLEELHGPTGCAVAFVGPDGERSFALRMGVSDRLSSAPPTWPEGFRVVYVSSTTLLEASGTREVALHLLARARRAGVEIAVSLENSALLASRAEELGDILWPGVHFLFANEAELEAVFGPEPEGATRALEVARLVFLKRGSRGASVLSSGARSELPAFEVRPLDTTGAGDFFAGAVLARLLEGSTPERACIAGNFLASQVVARLGACLPPELSPGSFP
jgi:sugar/nucleoside kinase (ribokinase family)